MFRTLGLRFLLSIAALAPVLPLPGGTALQGQAPAASGATFTVGVLRRDGVVVPFAAYDGGRWINRWPAPGRREDVPISVADSPRSWWLRDRPTSYWTVWPLRGDSQVVHVKSPINLTVECETQIGLQTDYKSVEPPALARMQPFPKDGLATSGDVLVEPLAILDGTSAEWTTVSAEVAAKVTEIETKLLSTARATTPLSDAERKKKPVTLEVLFRSPGPRPGTTQLYFEGVKRYGRPPESFRPYPTAPEMITYAVGWIRLDPEALPRITMTATLTDSRREGLLYTMGFGSFRVDGKLYWAVQRSGWGFERYDIVEISEPEVKDAFSTPGGVCR
jgi:hypothetical protein